MNDEMLVLYCSGDSSSHGASTLKVSKVYLNGNEVSKAEILKADVFLSNKSLSYSNIDGLKKDFHHLLGVFKVKSMRFVNTSQVAQKIEILGHKDSLKSFMLEQPQIQVEKKESSSFLDKLLSF